MGKNTPVKLSPAFKDYLWGGEKLKERYNKKTDMTPLAESWELSAHPDGESRISGGEYDSLTFTEYLDQVGSGVVGESVSEGEPFPILIKFIDACKDLSVQVHPDDVYASSHGGGKGKTEMWYVLDCSEGASLYCGFSRDVTKDELERAIKSGTLTEILNRVPIKRGDVFFIPAGTVHAIGAGALICEIQQNSNTTYRVYDYGRRDKFGKERELHVDRALDVATLTRSPELCAVPDGDDVLLSECEYFTVRRLRVNGRASISCDRSSFRSLTVISGEGHLASNGDEISLSCGDTVFIPAQDAELSVSGECELIVSHT